MNLLKKPVLLLNASYEAIRIISAKRSLTLLTKGKVAVELATDREVYPGVFLPSVIRLLVYKHVPVRMQQMTRKNLYLRDGYKCGYCGEQFSGSELTLDHIIPKAQGGKNTYENLITCCRKDNHRKADRTPQQAGMVLLRRPIPATVHTGRHIMRSLGLETQGWAKYLWADADGEQRLVARG
jgi:5-methylcytosine-specific restriction endonuclease McrA